MRLIDADRLKEYVNSKSSHPLCEWDTAGVLMAIDKQETVFDLDKVIEKLKELKTYKLNLADAMCELMNRDKLGTYVCLEDVIEVIR